MVIVEATADHTLSVRQMDARPSLVSSLSFDHPLRPMPTLTPTSTQNTEDGTALDGHVARVEDSPKIAELNDPYDFRNGIKSEADLAHMRKVHGYVARHLAQQPAKEDVETSRWRYSLMNWGHDPLKKG